MQYRINTSYPSIISFLQSVQTDSFPKVYNSEFCQGPDCALGSIVRVVGGSGPPKDKLNHYSYATMSAMVSHITNISTVCSTVMRKIFPLMMS